jgi:parallel beta-helix repeat protein
MMKSLLRSTLTSLMASWLVLVIASNSYVVKASADVSGIISADTTWTTENSPYTFTGPVGIAEGVTLTIEPGVTVNFVDYYMEVNGTLRAQGSNTNKIFFTSDASNGQLDTPSIRFMSISTSWNEQTDSGSIIENAVFDSVRVGISGASPKINNNSFGGGYFGSNPVSVNSGSNAIISNNTIDGTGSDSWGVGIGCGGDALICGNIISNWITSGVRISGGSPIIEGNLIVNNTGSQQSGGGGIRIDWAESTPMIRNNTIAQNKVGINLLNGPWPVIVNNNIQDNTNYNIYVQTNNVVGNPEHAINVTYNWWGTTDVSSINQTIYDYKNDYKLGTVTFVPFLTEPNPEAIPIPEFQSLVFLSLLITATLLIIVCKQKLPKTPSQQSY